MIDRTRILGLLAGLSLSACAAGDDFGDPLPSDQLDRDIQRTGEDAVQGIDTSGFDALG